ncbi:hypothetical protein B0H14DRAFT_3883281 [Mycena olivaceomarginata]|nr:hypothetical protein B0H14DRAFT_3883281 [Mycena olivaceomarginata]
MEELRISTAGSPPIPNRSGATARAPKDNVPCVPRVSSLRAASRFKICIPAALHDCDPELTIMLLRDPRLPDIGTSPSLILLPPSYSTPFLPFSSLPPSPPSSPSAPLSPSLLHDATAVVEAMLSVCPVRVTVLGCAVAVSCRRCQAGQVLAAGVRDVGPARGPVPVLVVSLRSPTHLLASPPFCDSACSPPMLSSPHSSPFLSRLPRPLLAPHPLPPPIWHGFLRPTTADRNLFADFTVAFYGSVG